MYKYYLVGIATQLTIAAYSPYVQIILRNKGYSYSLTGVIIALFQAAAILGPLLISSLTDRRGKTKPYLILSALLSIFSGIPFFLSDNVAVVIVTGALLSAFFWSLNPLTDGFLNRKLKGESFSYGKIRASGTMSYTLALILFAVIRFPDESDNRSILIVFTAALLLFSLVLALEKDDERVEKKERSAFSFRWFDKGFYLFMLIVAFSRVGQSVVEKLLTSYMTETLCLGSFFSLFIAIGSLCEFICMILFGKLLEKKKTTPLRMLMISSLGLVVRLLLYLIPNIYVFAFAQTLHGLTFGACHVAATSYVSHNVSSEHYEVGMSIYWALATNLPELVGSLMGGFVIDMWGYSTLFLSYSVFPLIALVLAFLFRKEIEKKIS